MADRFPGEQPNWNEPIADQSGRATLAWRNYFLRLASVQSSDDLRALYEALAARVAVLEDGESIDFQILGQGSVSVNGVPQPGNVVVISLQGDTALPGNTQYYGTGPNGAKGWFPISGAITVNGAELTKTVGADGVTTFGLADVPDSGAGTLLAVTRDGKGRVTGTRPATITGTAQQIDVANGNATAGRPTISLADLPNSGVGGALVKITRDAKGRVSGTQSATTDDLAEGAINLYFTTARAVAASPVKSVNARIGVVSVPDYVAKSTAPTATDFGRALIDGDRWLNTANGFTYTRYGSTWLAEAGANLTLPKGYIDGFKMIWNSAGSITFDSGTAYVESLGMNVLLNAAVTKTVSGLTPNTFYHNYLFISGGVADIEISATAPASPYNGTARSKTGDASRRYIGSFLTTTAGDIRRFVQSETEVSYLDTLGAVPYRILAAGSATTPTAVSVLPAAPVTAVQFKGQLINNAATGFFVISAPGGMLEIISVAQNSRGVQYLPIFNSQLFYYNTAAGGSSFIDLHAYVFER
ncbi:hypothetical protein ABW45_04785 [Stenotrophomonas maltophilia]|nr:hypothetical protein ABW45_04785 [Stenotrophomonas maltophilia]